MACPDLVGPVMGWPVRRPLAWVVKVTALSTTEHDMPRLVAGHEVRGADGLQVDPSLEAVTATSRPPLAAGTGLMVEVSGAVKVRVMGSASSPETYTLGVSAGKWTSPASMVPDSSGSSTSPHTDAKMWGTTTLGGMDTCPSSMDPLKGTSSRIIP